MHTCIHRLKTVAGKKEKVSNTCIGYDEDSLSTTTPSAQCDILHIASNISLPPSQVVHSVLDDISGTAHLPLRRVRSVRNMRALALFHYPRIWYSVLLPYTTTVSATWTIWSRKEQQLHSVISSCSSSRFSRLDFGTVFQGVGNEQNLHSSRFKSWWWM